MHATELLDRTIGPACQWMHKVRFEALKKATQAAMVARCMSVTGLGRAVEATCEKEGIKRNNGGRTTVLPFLNNGGRTIIMEGVK